MQDPQSTQVRGAKASAIISRHVGPCREWVDAKANICGATSEFVLWGKLIPPEGLGPRCYEHAAKHIGYHGLYSRSNYALINIADLAHDLCDEDAS